MPRPYKYTPSEIPRRLDQSSSTRRRCTGERLADRSGEAERRRLLACRDAGDPEGLRLRDEPDSESLSDPESLSEPLEEPLEEPEEEEEAERDLCTGVGQEVYAGCAVVSAPIRLLPLAGVLLQHRRSCPSSVRT